MTASVSARFPSHPLVAASHVEEALVGPRVDAELRPLVVNEERLFRDGARVRPRAQQVHRLDPAQELVVQALYAGSREEAGRGGGGVVGGGVLICFLS